MSAAPAASPWRVLVVEDNAAVAALHCKLIETLHDFRTVAVVSNGEAAYRAVEVARPDVAVVDLNTAAQPVEPLVRSLCQSGARVLALDYRLSAIASRLTSITGARREMNSRRPSPLMSSIAANGRPSCSPTSKIDMIFG